jgi:hypothetical protein
MFPNIRLLIAAAMASVVALGCGFGVFAAFRVSHEPLMLMPIPVASAPLPPLIDNTVTQPLAFAAEPFKRRFLIGEQQHGEALEALTRMLARHESAAGPDRPAAIDAKEPASIEARAESPASPAAQPAEATAPKTAAPVPTGDVPIASLATPLAVSNAESPAMSSSAATVEPAPTAPAEAPSMAAVTPEAEPIKPEIEAAPATVTKAAVGEKTEGTPPAQAHAAKKHRTRRTARAADQSDAQSRQGTAAQPLGQ